MNLKDVDFENLKYEQKQKLIEKLKSKYAIKYGFVDKYYRVINCYSYTKLKENLSLASSFNNKILLVIQ